MQLDKHPGCNRPLPRLLSSILGGNQRAERALAGPIVTQRYALYASTPSTLRFSRSPPAFVLILTTNVPLRRKPPSSLQCHQIISSITPRIQSDSSFSPRVHHLHHPPTPNPVLDRLISTSTVRLSLRVSQPGELQRSFQQSRGISRPCRYHGRPQTPKSLQTMSLCCTHCTGIL